MICLSDRAADMFKLTILAIATFISATLGFVLDPKAADIRIVGGSDAAEGQFPYQVSIRRASTGGHNCGGSIINSKWILTAAHCLTNSAPSDWFIFAGSASLSGNGVVRQISQFVLHPDYGVASLINDDIAVIELQEELEFSANIQPVELETEDVGTVECVASGWGLLATGSIIPDILQFIDLRTLTSAQCQGVWGSFFADDREVCTLTQRGEGFCTGDSGGPLVADGKQIGIVAWGNVPCGGGNPDVYTKVSAFTSWIQNSIN